MSAFVAPARVAVALVTLRDLHRHRRLLGRGAGAAGSEPAARRVADDDRPAVRVVRRDAADRVDPDGRGLRSHRPQGAAGRRAARAGGRRRCCSRFADGLPWLFAARLVQGAADAVTWVVGFALIADLYGPDERGRVSGIVMSGTSVAFMVGPSIGGWLYEAGGIRAPFLARRRRSPLLAPLGFLWLDVPSARARDRAGADRRRAAIAPPSPSAPPSSSRSRRRSRCSSRCCRCSCSAKLGLGPARIGLVFGCGAVASAILHPIYGRLADRWGGAAPDADRPARWRPACCRSSTSTWSYPSAIALLRAEHDGGRAGDHAVARLHGRGGRRRAGVGSFGVGYGLYNMAWGAGLLGGPAIGGFVFERARLRAADAARGRPMLLLVSAAACARVQIATVAPKLAVEPDGASMNRTRRSPR